MTVGELFASPLGDVTVQVPPAVAARAVSGLALDSRKVRSGDVFFALAGQHHEGSRFVAEALQRGAVAVALSDPAAQIKDAVVVSQARRALAFASARFFDHPDRRLALIGVTGTNGKTTTALLVASIAEVAGAEKLSPSGFIGTLGSRIGERWTAGSFTTPEAPDLCALLSEMVAAGVGGCAMEVSSHALAQDRVAGLVFSAAGFTHLTRDHLDFHGDFENYFLAKRRLFFELLGSGATSVVNGDDAFGRRLAQELTADLRPVLRFGRGAEAELRITKERLSLTGTEFNLQTPQGVLQLRSSLIGAHNAENLALAAGLGLAAGFSVEHVARGAGALAAVPGRLERVAVPTGMEDGPLGFVDYAHTDDALTRVLATLRTLGASGARRLVVVFGCGGNRDPGKRPLMGRAAARGADLVVATSDNPRDEEPAEILAEVVPGLRDGGKTELTFTAAKGGASGFLVEPDRRAAIALAVSLARPEDVVLVAGKGHETTQTIGTRKLAFDDRIELREALERRAA